ncbi:MAG: hypothetical protein LBB40_01315 [Holophagales bacterium]|nr:hypothetical protein [Holophagales bacterium]
MIIEPVAKLAFCNFNGVDRLCQNGAGRDTGALGLIRFKLGRLCQNGAGRDTGAEDIITGADRNGVLQLPQ